MHDGDVRLVVQVPLELRERMLKNDEASANMGRFARRAIEERLDRLEAGDA